jgi:hypothetical protein
VREDGRFRTNVIVTNVTEASLDVDIAIHDAGGTLIGTQRVASLQPLEMRQISRVVRGSTNADVAGVTLVLSTPTSGGAFAAYAAVIDNTTNDPRTLLPSAGTAGLSFLPSSARAQGANGAFFTTDLTVGNRGTSDAEVSLRFLGNNKDGRTGPERTITIPAGQTRTFTDVLQSLFGLEADFGAIRIQSTSPLAVLGQTSTPPPNGQGTFGQSVPAQTSRDLVSAGSPRTIAAIREDARFRTNLIVTNATESPIDVVLKLLAEDGSLLGERTLTGLAPLEMRQISRIVQELAGRSDVASATLRLETPTTGGSFAAYAAVIDNVTNDPRTLLPK